MGKIIVYLCSLLVAGLVGWSCNHHRPSFVEWQNEATRIATPGFLHPDMPLPIVPKAELTHTLVQYQSLMRQLLRVDTALLDTTEHKAYFASVTNLDSLLRILSDYQKDPSVYNLGGYLVRTLSIDTLPLTQRIALIEKQLESAPAYFEAAKQNIREPHPDRCRLASQKQLLTLQLLTRTLPDSLKRVSLSPAQLQQFKSNTLRAEKAVKDYLLYCNKRYFE